MLEKIESQKLEENLPIERIDETNSCTEKVQEINPFTLEGFEKRRKVLALSFAIIFGLCALDPDQAVALSIGSAFLSQLFIPVISMCVYDKIKNKCLSDFQPKKISKWLEFIMSPLTNLYLCFTINYCLFLIFCHSLPFILAGIDYSEKYISVGVLFRLLLSLFVFISTFISLNFVFKSAVKKYINAGLAR